MLADMLQTLAGDISGIEGNNHNGDIDDFIVGGQVCMGHRSPPGACDLAEQMKAREKINPK